MFRIYGLYGSSRFSRDYFVPAITARQTTEESSPISRLLAQNAQMWAYFPNTCSGRYGPSTRRPQSKHPPCVSYLLVTRNSFHKRVPRRPGYITSRGSCNFNSCSTNESWVVLAFSFGLPVFSDDLGLPTYLIPPASSPNHHLNHIELHTPAQDSITMRSIAILATICAATVGTASGKDTVQLVHVQHMCDATC